MCQQDCSLENRVTAKEFSQGKESMQTFIIRLLLACVSGVTLVAWVGLSYLGVVGFLWVNLQLPPFLQDENEHRTA